MILRNIIDKLLIRSSLTAFIGSANTFKVGLQLRVRNLIVRVEDFFY